MNNQQQTSNDDVLALPDFDDDDDLLAEGKRPVPRKRRNRWLIAIAVVLLLLILSGTLLAILHNRRPHTAFLTQTVTRGNLALTVNATGPIQGNIYNVNFSGSGKLSRIDVRVGQQVKQNQALAALDMTSLEDAVNQAQTALNAAEATLSSAEANLSGVVVQGSSSVNTAYDVEQNALNTCNNTPNPPPRCVQLAEDQYAQAQRQAYAQTTSATSQVTTAQGAVNTDQAALKTAQDNLNNATLLAPHSGIVATINGTVGGTPGASSTGSATGSSPFIQIVDLSSLQVYAAVNEADIASISNGQTAYFTVSAYGSHKFQGTVSAISPLGQTVSNVVTYTVIIQVNMNSMNGAHLLPGMTANTTITTDTRSQAVLIPADAVNFAQSQSTAGAANSIPHDQITTALAQAQQLLNNLEGASTSTRNLLVNPTPSYVLERSHNQWLVKPVVLGLTDGTSYEVLAGLTPGETVVTGVQTHVAGLFGGLFHRGGANGGTSGSGTGG